MLESEQRQYFEIIRHNIIIRRELFRNNDSKI